MSKVTDVVNNERNIHLQKKLHDDAMLNSYKLYDKEKINDTIILMIDLLQMFKDKKTKDAQGNLKKEVRSKIVLLNKNITIYSSYETIKLHGLFINSKYLKDQIEPIEEVYKDYIALVIGYMVIASMKNDLNPLIPPNIKPLLMIGVNDFDNEKSNIFKILHEKINKIAKSKCVYE